MAVQIQIRRGTAAEWYDANPTLALGEMGYETNSGFIKIGDGIADWRTLAYVATGGGGTGTGVNGPTGPEGDIGPTGPTGPASTVAGPTGPQGVAGPTGPAGDGGGGSGFSIEYTISNNGNLDYIIEGFNDPILNLVRGFTYTFNINAAGHPFWIKTAAVSGTDNAYNVGVTNNGTDVGTITFSVPLGAPNTLYYVCENHTSMSGVFNVVNLGAGSTGSTSLSSLSDVTLSDPTSGDVLSYNGTEWVNTAGGGGSGTGPTGPTGPAGNMGNIGPVGASGAAGPTGVAGPTGSSGPSGPGLVAGGITGQVLSKASNLDYDTQWISVSGGGGGGLGPTGPTGPQGNDGDRGPTGAQGDRGDAGPQGPSGATGPAGPASAIAGPSGPTGPSGAGLPGDPGPSGPVGPTGPIGPTGAGLPGNPGVQGPTGPSGADGTPGGPGPSGVGGPTGASGPPGPSGVNGTPGPSGVPGVSGPQGVQGPVGAQGPQGIQGPQGVQGPTGPASTVAGPTGPTGPSLGVSNPLSSIFTITNTTVAASTATGALQVAGGVGIGGDLNVGNKVLLGDMALASANTRLAYTYTNTSVISVWPTLDITGSGIVNSADSLPFIRFLLARDSVFTTTNYFPQAINHYANTGTGISILDMGPLAYSVNRTNSDGVIFITSANKQSGIIKNYIAVGNVLENSGPVNAGTGVVILNDSTASTVGTYITAVTPLESISTITGALVVNGGVGIGGNANIGNDIFLGNTTETLSRTVYPSTNRSKIFVRPSMDISGNGAVASNDALALEDIVRGARAVNSSTNFNVPFVLTHADNTTTGLMVLGDGPLAYAVDRNNAGGLIYITSGDKVSNNINAYIRVGVTGTGVPSEATSQVRVRANTTWIGTGTQSISTATGSLVVDGGVGIGGNANIGNILSLTVSTAAPASPAVGMFAVADRVTWDPAAKGSGNAYPVFYNGATWNALY